MDTNSNRGLMSIELGAPDHVTRILQAENRQKVDKFKPVYLG